MAQVTTEQVDALLGSGWAESQEEKDRAVMQANAYLSGLKFKTFPDDEQPDQVTQAGAELAKLSHAGTLFVTTQGDIKRKRVKGGPVETETEYMEGTAARAGELKFVDALLSPWIAKRGAVSILKRL